MQATVLFQKYLKPLALPLILFPAMAHSDDDWTDVVLTKIRGLQYQETLNDPFSNQQQADRSQEAGSTPTSCVRHPLACAFDLYEKKGLFEATIGGYKRSDSAIDGFFNKTAVFTDANVFVTLTTLLYLMDANQYLSEDMSGLIDPAVEAIADFHDRNTPDASLVGFWEQESINNYWVTYSTNGSRLIEDLDGIETVLRDACELIFSDRDCEAHFPGYPGGKAETYLPSDTDDTSENLSVGALLAELQTNPAYQAAYQAWRSQNSPAKIKAALGQIIHYAYDADGQSAASNLIDPRTFYFLSGFYEGGAARGTRIPTTWLLDDDEVFEKHYRGRGEWPTPHLALHNVNDIDPIELGHFITAVARLDRSGLLEEAIAGDESFADDLGKIALNATEYIAYLISNDVPYSRPDILAPYYAYAAQAYEALGNFVAVTQGYSPALPQLADAAELALKSMEQTGTAQLVAHHVESGGSGQVPQVYWEGILRNREIDGDEVVRDRAFSTAAAVSALLDTWTEPAADGGLRWRQGADAFLTGTLVPEAVDFIKQAAMEPLEPITAIAFVGATSVSTSEIYRYPANHYTYLDGEEILSKDCVVNACPTATYGVLGFIPREQYKELLAKGPFDFGPTPEKAGDWGSSGTSARIWRSDAQAYALALKVVAQFEQIKSDA